MLHIRPVCRGLNLYLSLPIVLNQNGSELVSCIGIGTYLYL